MDQDVNRRSPKAFSRNVMKRLILALAATALLTPAAIAADYAGHFGDMDSNPDGREIRGVNAPPIPTRPRRDLLQGPKDPSDNGPAVHGREKNGRA
jgi:hypothetical protein